MIEIINVGTTPNDHSGDSLRDAFIKVNANFQELVIISGDVESINVILEDLQDQIDGKAPLVHTHTISQIINLQAILDSKLDILTYIGDMTAVNASIQAINDALAEMIDILNTKIEDAPFSGITYGRNDGQWVPIPVETKLNGVASVVWTGVGFIFDVVYPSYYIQGVLYSGGTNQVTLDPSDPTDPRFDLFIINASGATAVTGVPSADPVLPSVDENLNIIISNILIDAGSTEPTNIYDTPVYKENVEWSGTTNIASCNFNSTVLPFQGAKCIDVVAFQ